MYFIALVCINNHICDPPVCGAAWPVFKPVCGSRRVWCVVAPDKYGDMPSYFDFMWEFMWEFYFYFYGLCGLFLCGVCSGCDLLAIANVAFLDSHAVAEAGAAR